MDIYKTNWTDKEYQDLKKEWDSISKEERNERFLDAIDNAPGPDVFPKTLIHKLLRNYKKEIIQFRKDNPNEFPR